MTQMFWVTTFVVLGNAIHFHVMPRRSGDGLLRVYAERVNAVPREALDRQAAAIRVAMSGSR